jgi:hypothetical protein
MAGDDTVQDMTKVSRPVHGPRSIASLVPVVARTAFRRTSPGVAQLTEAWTDIVGPTLAAATGPRALAQGTLTIGCSGPMAMELQHLSTELIARVNRSLGSQTVRRLRFVQTFTNPVPRRVLPRPSAVITEAASAAVAHLQDGPIRSALASLGQALLTESASRLGKQPRTRC